MHSASVLVTSLSAIGLALIVASGIFLVFGINPFEAYQKMIAGSLGSTFGLMETIRRAIPLLIIAIGLNLAFRLNYWNIGAEGQLLSGAVAANGVALFSGLNGWILLPAMFVAAATAGALWGMLTAYLKSVLAINEIVTTLMLNYVAGFGVLYLIHGPWKGTDKFGFAYSNTFTESAWLSLVPGSGISWFMAVFALVCAGLMWFVINKTTLGYAVRVVGENPVAARTSGISYAKTALIVMCISGGLAGLAGFGEVAGIHHMLRHPDQISLGYGYTAIIVAWLARRSPIASIITALLFGAMLSGGDSIKVSLGVPAQAVIAINGLILLFLIGSERIDFASMRIWTSLRQRYGRGYEH